MTYQHNPLILSPSFTFPLHRLHYLFYLLGSANTSSVSWSNLYLENKFFFNSFTKLLMTILNIYDSDIWSSPEVETFGQRQFYQLLSSFWKPLPGHCLTFPFLGSFFPAQPPGTDKLHNSSWYNIHNWKMLSHNIPCCYQSSCKAFRALTRETYITVSYRGSYLWNTTAAFSNGIGYECLVLVVWLMRKGTAFSIISQFYMRWII